MKHSLSVWTWIYLAIAAASSVFGLGDPAPASTLPAVLLSCIFAFLAVATALMSLACRAQAPGGSARAERDHRSAADSHG